MNKKIFTMSKNAVALEMLDIGKEVKMPTVEFSPNTERVPPSWRSINSESNKKENS